MIDKVTGYRNLFVTQHNLLPLHIGTILIGQMKRHVGGLT